MSQSTHPHTHTLTPPTYTPHTHTLTHTTHTHTQTTHTPPTHTHTHTHPRTTHTQTTHTPHTFVLKIRLICVACLWCKARHETSQSVMSSPSAGYSCIPVTIANAGEKDKQKMGEPVPVNRFSCRWQNRAVQSDRLHNDQPRKL